ncbi:hypothetical protein D3C81_1643770 [compost metagenome]
MFFLKGFLSILCDTYFVSKGWLSYPDRFFPNIFQTTIVFAMLAYPLLCVLYNQTSYRSGLGGILTQAVLYSIPPTLFEWWAAENTRLVKFHNWTWYYSFFFFLGTFLAVRGAIGLIRIYSNKKGSPSPA